MHIKVLFLFFFVYKVIFQQAIAENVDVIAKKLARLRLCKEEYTALLRTANPAERVLPAPGAAAAAPAAPSTRSDRGGEAKEGQRAPAAAPAGVLL